MNIVYWSIEHYFLKISIHTIFFQKDHSFNLFLETLEQYVWLMILPSTFIGLINQFWFSIFFESTFSFLKWIKKKDLKCIMFGNYPWNQWEMYYLNQSVEEEVEFKQNLHQMIPRANDWTQVLIFLSFTSDIISYLRFFQCWLKFALINLC